MNIWFSHDSNARRDPKIQGMRAEFGGSLLPYAWFFVLIEIFREQESDGYKLKYDRQTKLGLCMELSMTLEELDKFVQAACECKLLVIDDEGYIFSESLLSRMAIKDAVSEKRRASAKAYWDKVKGVSGNPEKSESMDTDNAKVIFQTWLDAGLIQHTKLTSKMRTKIKSAIKDYNLEQIITAINNYAKIHNDPNLGYYSWTLDEFMSRGISKFYTDHCFENAKRFKKPGKEIYKETGEDDVKFGR